MFSERYGYSPIKEIMVETVSVQLRNKVWNLFYREDIEPRDKGEKKPYYSEPWEPPIEITLLDNMGLIVDASVRGIVAQQKLQRFLIHNCEWYQVYDFIESHLLNIGGEERRIRRDQYNDLLEEQKSGYRIHGCEVVPITNQEELNTISQAMDTKYAAPNMHIEKALKLYADRQNPDYQNSVKESISAVEAMCCIITGMSGANATLNAALKKLKDCGVHIHPAMERAFGALYGYTSDEGGIRHGGIDFVGVPAEDAKYMLVTCSAFINYLVEKWSKVSR